MEGFAKTIYELRYRKGNESWEQCTNRVIDSVVSIRGDLPLEALTAIEIVRTAMNNFEFLPAGRYLAAAGTKHPQVKNCYCLDMEDSKESIAKVYQDVALLSMTGAGVGINFSKVRAKGDLISTTGGFASGPLCYMEAICAIGRASMSAGYRRAALYGELSWKHKDIFDFINTKQRSELERQLKTSNYDHVLPLDIMNISVSYDKEFLEAYNNTAHVLHEHAHKVFDLNVHLSLTSADPGFAFHVLDDKYILKNACVSGDTLILTKEGHKAISECVNQKLEIWNGFEWSEVEPKITGHNEEMLMISFSDGRKLKCTKYHKFHIKTGYGKNDLVVLNANELQEGHKLIRYSMPIIGTGVEADFNAYSQGFKSGDGMDDYNFIPLYSTKYCCYKRLTGEELPENKINQNRICVKQNTCKPKSYIPFELNLQGRLDWLAGLSDSDGSVTKDGALQISSVDLEFLTNVQKLCEGLGLNGKLRIMKNAEKRILPNGKNGKKEFDCKKLHRLFFSSAEVAELLNIGYKTERLVFTTKPNRTATHFTSIESIQPAGVEATVYCFNEPKRHLGVFNGICTGQCTEFCSDVSGNSCNLGSIYLNKFVNRQEEFRALVDATVLFLMLGNEYSSYPKQEWADIAKETNQIGLGLAGISEFLIRTNSGYNFTPAMREMAEIFEEQSERSATTWAEVLRVNRPAKIRAIAPTGTTSIIASTTSGVEPIFACAYERGYLGKDNKWTHELVIDAAAQRLLDEGFEPEEIFDSYSLGFEQRVAFQAELQKYVDQAISSTVNLPNTQFPKEEAKSIILKYMPYLKGLTTYPDGAVSNQPLRRVELKEALKRKNSVIDESENTRQCKGGSCSL